jgi:hypothetical protein
MDTVLGRRHEPRSRAHDRLLHGPVRLGGRDRSAARGGRLHDVHEGRQVRRRREPAATGRNARVLDDLPRERRRRRDRPESSRRRRHRHGGSVRRVRVRPDGRSPRIRPAPLRRLAGRDAHRRAARERARDAELESVPDERPRPCRQVLRRRLRLRDRRGRHGRR